MIWLWRKLKSAMRESMRQQITLGGIIYTIAILLVAMAAFGSANNLLFLLLAAMIATLLVSNFVSRLGLAGLEFDFQLPEHVSSRRRVAGRIVVINQKRWIPSFSIHVTGGDETGLTQPIYFPVVPGRSSISDTVEVYFSRRGLHTDNTFQFSTRFPFGFAERMVHVRLPREVLVYPCIDARPGFEDILGAVSGEMASHVRGRGNDFYRIRPYHPLESARHVDWKATAHTGDLQVREFAREQDPLVQIFLDLDVPSELTGWFENAVNCCAFLVWRIGQKDSRVHLRTQVASIRIPEDGDVYTILKYLAVVTPTVGTPVAPHDEYSVHVVLSSSPAPILEAGWSGSYLLDPRTLPAPAVGTDAPNTAPGSE